jgi:hypothetical protein
VTTKELLECARDRIKDPERWTRGAMAVNYSAQTTEPTAPGAVRWCAAGAILACGANPTEYYEARSALCKGSGISSVVLLNDHDGHAAVMEMYDAAIAAA